MNKEARKLIKNNRGSYYINLPKHIVKEIKWKDNQKLFVKKTGNKIIISDWSK